VEDTEIARNCDYVGLLTQRDSKYISGLKSFSGETSMLVFWVISGYAADINVSEEHNSSIFRASAQLDSTYKFTRHLHMRT
jgi:hypothetical protein